jgi:hypothetical protein
MTPFEKAKRIWSAPNEQPNQYAAFRTRFRIDGIPQSAILQIRADNRYSVTLNGEWIPAQQYADYDFYPVYDEIVLPSSLFCVGENTIDVLCYCQNETSAIYRRGEPSLIFELSADGAVLAFSGENTTVTTNTGFQSGVMKKMTPQLGYSFRYSLQQAQNPVYERATVLPERTMDYRPRPIPQLTVGDPIPARITAQGVFLKSEQTESGKAISSDFLSARAFKEKNFIA